jgi:hypothetical protein
MRVKNGRRKEKKTKRFMTAQGDATKQFLKNFGSLPYFPPFSPVYCFCHPCFYTIGLDLFL